MFKETGYVKHGFWRWVDMMQEFVQAIYNAIDKKIGEVHTCVPGKIVSFDASTGLATVLPTMQFKRPDGTRMDYPQISGVPVVIPQASGQNAVIAYPVKAGDGCLVLFSEQSIDYWMYGQQTDTDLKFDLTNAICIPGLFPKVNGALSDACKLDAVIIKNGTASISLKNGGITVNGNLTVNGKITAIGDVSVSGSVSASGDVTGAGVSLSGHMHTDSQGGQTSAPIK